MTGRRVRCVGLFRSKYSSSMNSTLSTEVVVVFVCRSDDLRFLGRIGVSDRRWPEALERVCIPGLGTGIEVDRTDRRFESVVFLL